jgi:hypothetical protein
LVSAKVGVRINRAYDFDFMTHNLSLKATSELASNLTDSKFIKSKIFTRYSMPLSDKFYIQSSASSGFINNLTPNELKINDTFYLKNFKGVRNIGYHYDSSAKTKEAGILGENLGFDRYLNFSTKIY